jgi:DNA-nicking Smr family endonuclease
MSGRGRSKGRGQSPLSGDDEALWAHTARTVAPLTKGKPRVHPSVSEEASGVVFAPRGKARQGIPASVARRAVDEATTVKPKSSPDLQPFDAKRARKLRAGRIEIEARLDLHGMKQVEAHAALRRFLHDCHRDGRRTVLVITGKGGPSGKDGGDERHWTHGHERGVLKRNVPHWLEEPDLRRIVVSYTTASVRHGGEGAIYVQLRAVTRV